MEPNYFRGPPIKTIIPPPSVEGPYEPERNPDRWVGWSIAAILLLLVLWTWAYPAQAGPISNELVPAAAFQFTSINPEDQADPPGWERIVWARGDVDACIWRWLDRFGDGPPFPIAPGHFSTCLETRVDATFHGEIGAGFYKFTGQRLYPAPGQTPDGQGTVPEPSTIALIAAAILALGVRWKP